MYLKKKHVPVCWQRKNVQECDYGSGLFVFGTGDTHLKSKGSQKTL